jgi:VCBS repeat-containing protein
MKTRQIIAVMIGMLVAGAPAWATDGPKLQFGTMVYDFGTTSQVDRLQGTYVFTNAGNAVLQIQKPHPSCGCTVASVKPETLQPGEKGELTFTLNVPQGANGHIEKFITVPSNDPQNPSQRLTIKTDVRMTYDVKPMQVAISTLREGATTNVTFTVRRVDKEKLVLTKVETDNPMLSAKIEMVGETNNPSAQIVVEVKATSPPRFFSEGLRVYAENTNTPAMHLSVSGRVVGELTVTPETLLWSITDPEDWPGSRPIAVTTRRVIVSAAQTGKTLEVSNLTCSLPDLNLELQTVETGMTYAVVAKLPKAPAETKQGTIRFATNLPKYTEVQVPFVIQVLPPRRLPVRALSAPPAAPAAPAAPAKP